MRTGTTRQALLASYIRLLFCDPVHTTSQVSESREYCTSVAIKGNGSSSLVLKNNYIKQQNIIKTKEKVK